MWCHVHSKQRTAGSVQRTTARNEERQCFGQEMFSSTAIVLIYAALSLCRSVPHFCLACMGTGTQQVGDTGVEVHAQEWPNDKYPSCSFRCNGNSRLMKVARILVSLSIPSNDLLLQELPACSLKSPDIPQKWHSSFQRVIQWQHLNTRMLRTPMIWQANIDV